MPPVPFVAAVSLSAGCGTPLPLADGRRTPLPFVELDRGKCFMADFLLSGDGDGVAASPSADVIRRASGSAARTTPLPSGMTTNVRRSS
jgi:hypothetical protein